MPHSNEISTIPENRAGLPAPSYVVPLTAVTFGVGAAATLLFHPTLIAELVTVGGFATAGVSGLLAWVRGRVIAEAAPSPLPSPLENTERLRRALTRFRYTEGVEAEGERALAQLKELEARFEAYEKLLLSRLSPTELTFQRYLAAGEQAYLAALDNLESASQLIGSLSAGAAERVEERLARLSSASGETQSLRARLDALREERRKLDGLLDFNEQAILGLERTTQAVSELKELETRASQSLEDTLKELEELAKRASKYHT